MRRVLLATCFLLALLAVPATRPAPTHADQVCPDRGKHTGQLCASLDILRYYVTKGDQTMVVSGRVTFDGTEQETGWIWKVDWNAVSTGHKADGAHDLVFHSFTAQNPFDVGVYSVPCKADMVSVHAHGEVTGIPPDAKKPVTLSVRADYTGPPCF